MTSEWRTVMRDMTGRTRSLFSAGRRVCDGVSGRLRWELRLTWLGGSRILDKLERADFDVFTARPTVGAWDVPGLLPRRCTLALSDLSVARDTNFYYSFLVLTPAKRQAIIAVWDFCRAVDDAVDEVGEQATLPSRSRAGAGKLPIASKAGRRRLDRAARWRRSSRSSASRGSRSSLSSRASRWISRRAATRPSTISISTASASHRPSA